MNDFPKLSSIKAAQGLSVHVAWKSGVRTQRTETVDLAPLINTHTYYKPLRDDRALFESVRLTGDGAIVTWGDAALDMAVTSIERLALQQQSRGTR